MSDCLHCDINELVRERIEGQDNVDLADLVARMSESLAETIMLAPKEQWAVLMAEAIPGGKRVTLGGDKNYDTQEFVRELRGMNITPRVAQNDTYRSSAIDQRTARHPSYEVSQQKRKRVEQSFGWMKMVGMLRKVKLRGMDKVGWLFTFTGAAYNLFRLRNLMARA